MEWIDGEPLDCFLEHGLPDDREFLRMAGELCDALSYLHSRQMIHRDLKPSNIMVTHSGHVIKLIDFGLSDSSTYSILKAPAGTRGFIAPEVLAGSAADVRSDIWSLGMVLRRMNGRHKNVISKCLHKNPQKRYRSAGAVREALCRRPLWPALAALVAVAAAAFIYIPSRKESPQESTERLAPDTIVVIMQPPKDTITRTVPPPRKQSAADESKDSQLDRIFQQASELLEEKI